MKHWKLNQNEDGSSYGHLSPIIISPYYTTLPHVTHDEDLNLPKKQNKTVSTIKLKQFCWKFEPIYAHKHVVLGQLLNCTDEIDIWHNQSLFRFFTASFDLDTLETATYDLVWRQKKQWAMLESKVSHYKTLI